MANLRIWTLGDFRVELDGIPITHFVTDKVRALLAYLAVESGRAHTRQHLAGLLWSSQPEDKALHSLRQTLSTLRKVLNGAAPGVAHGDGSLHISREYAQLTPGRFWVDVVDFESGVGAALQHHRPGSPASRLHVRRLQQAAALFCGPLLDGFSLSGAEGFEEWLALRQEALCRSVIDALTLLVEYHERRGEYALARGCAARLVDLARWDETAHAELMRLYAADGQWSAAMNQYRVCRRYLAEELGVPPAAETTALFEAVRQAAAAQQPLAVRHPVAPLCLPPAFPRLIGRERELDDLARLLADPACRLLTLTGPGGIGKTRLAIEAAREQAGLFGDGVYIVELTGATTVELVAPAIAAAVGFAFSERADAFEQLLGYLRDKRLLLLLDSVEHLPGIADPIARILDAAPGCVLVITSRARLNLKQEWLYGVEGLACPPMPSPAALPSACNNYGAVTLFDSCAGRAGRRTRMETLPVLEQQAIVRICRLVEGVPLAIELAAAATWTRSCEALAGELARDLDALHTPAPDVPDRQRSVRAAFEHSWQLLAPAEQEALRRLSVFRGAFREMAAAQVAGADAAMLAALCEKSLLRRTGTDRHAMHNLIRQFAAEKLATDANLQVGTQAAHASYFAALLEQVAPRLRGRGRKQAYDELAADQDDIRQAWLWAVEHGAADLLARSVEPLYVFYRVGSRFREGAELFDALTARGLSAERQHAAHGMALARQGALLYHLGSYEQARSAVTRSLQMIADEHRLRRERVFCLLELANLARRAGDYAEVMRLAEEARAIALACCDDGDGSGVARDVASVLFLMGQARQNLGDLDAAERLLRESLAAGRASDDPGPAVSALNALADLACYRGDYATARSMLEECVATSRELGDDYKLALHLNNLATVHHVQGQYADAGRLYECSLEICRRVGDREGMGIALSNLGEVACSLGDHARARRCYEDGLALGREIGEAWTIMVCLNNLGEVAGLLGDERAAVAYLHEALALAEQTQTLPMLMKVLVNVAALYERRSREAQAGELLALAWQHPACDQDVRDCIARGHDAADLAAHITRPLGEVVPETLRYLNLI
jgi:predicted ATPase/DNA-binding SARP family transcriptional activator